MEQLAKRGSAKASSSFVIVLEPATMGRQEADEGQQDGEVDVVLTGRPESLEEPENDSRVENEYAVLRLHCVVVRSGL
jgi:hypothetical protein